LGLGDLAWRVHPMKAWMLQMLILHADVPPTVQYYDTRLQCVHDLADWTVRTMQSHPTKRALFQSILIEDGPEEYPSILVGRFWATCTPTDKQVHQPWENTSP
jgi:hypothetical protein